MNLHAFREIFKAFFSVYFVIEFQPVAEFLNKTAVIPLTKQTVCDSS